ncbi:MAG TPA: heme exporter protein CcmB [Longimicrobiales bacterium]|nr:heme exporter protein CcmB [Longimicrobiales bacterium]
MSDERAVPGWLSVVAAVAGKDLRIEFRTRSRSFTMAGFVVLVGVLFNFSIDQALVRPQDIASGLTWITLILSGLIGVGRTFAIEKEDGAMSGLLLTPAPRDAIYIGKVVANFILVFGIVLLTLGVFGLFFRLDYGNHPGTLLLVLGAGALGFVALATLFGALTASTTLGESLLPILLFPLLVPMVVYGASASGRLLAGRPVAEVAGQGRMLAAFAVLALGAGAALFGQIVEE